MYRSDAGGIDENFIAFTPFHHLRVAGHDLHSGAVGGCFDAHQYVPELGHGQPFLQNKAEGQILRHRSAHRQVVNRAVHGQFADVAAGEKQGRNYVAVCCEGGFAGQFQNGPVVVSI